MLNSKIYISIKLPAQWAVSITSVLNRKNGFAVGKIGVKVAVAQSHEEQLLWQSFYRFWKPCYTIFFTDFTNLYFHIYYISNIFPYWKNIFLSGVKPRTTATLLRPKVQFHFEKSGLNRFFKIFQILLFERRIFPYVKKSNTTAS